MDKLNDFRIEITYNGDNNVLNIYREGMDNKQHNSSNVIFNKDDIVNSINDALHGTLDSSTIYNGLEFNIRDPFTINSNNKVDFINTLLERYVINEHECPILTTDNVSDQFYDTVYRLIKENRVIGTLDSDSLKKDIMKCHEPFLAKCSLNEHMAIASIGAFYDFPKIVCYYLGKMPSLFKSITILGCACMNNSIRIVEMLYHWDIDIHMCKDLCCYFALINNNVTVASYLMAKGAKFNHHNNNALAIACANGYHGVLDQLLMYGVKLDSDGGMAAAKHAIRNNDEYSLRRLITYGIRNTKYYDDIIRFAESEYNNKAINLLKGPARHHICPL